MYNCQEIEEKVKKFWEGISLYKTPKNPEKKFYLLEMFAYPSGDIHIGHFRNYTIGDVIWKYKRMRGFDILHPFGWDAFGLPAEQAAIKRGISPKEWTMNNIKISKNTLKRLGISYDWDREILTCVPEYYRWTQWLFLKLYSKGLVYRKKSYVNWCPECKTVLANEQVIGGVCWRCGTPVIKKEMEQWYIKITDYAERLLNDLDKLGQWPENIKIMQRNWIGRSEGVEIHFPVDNKNKLPVFTTRADTLYGVTFLSIAPEHPFVQKFILKRSKNSNEIQKYVEDALKKPEIERTREDREKTGVRTGLFAKHPLTGENIEIWVADYVIYSYGTGIVMGVPAHDGRDFLFAKKYGLPMKVVIKPENGELNFPLEEAYEDCGIMVNSGEFSGLSSEKGIEKIASHLNKVGLGKKKVTYRLRDWLISRQRYWGAPIPMVYCEKCGYVPVLEKDLPVLLPDEKKVDFIPKGRSPLEDVSEFSNTTCPKCGGKARRDPDTMDTFVDSSWYFLRYLDPKNQDEIFDSKEAEKWLPIDLYIGGVEHATGHLLYYRFITKFLYDIGLIPVDEPTVKLFNQGMVRDESGDIMSKSKGNVVSPVELIDEVGIDAARLSILFFAPPEREILWSKKGVRGAERFLQRVYNIFVRYLSRALNKDKIEDVKDGLLYKKVEYFTKRITDDMEKMQFNTGIAGLMELLNDMEDYKNKGSLEFQYSLYRFNLLLAPFAPYLAEEIYHWWKWVGKEESIFFHRWPEYNANALKEDETTIIIQVNGKFRDKVRLPVDKEKDFVFSEARKLPKIQKYLANNQIKNVIYVKNKVLNIVI